MSGSVLLRKPKWNDIPDLIALARQLHAEGWYGHIELDESRVGTFFVDHILNEETLFCRSGEHQNLCVTE